MDLLNARRGIPALPFCHVTLRGQIPKPGYPEAARTVGEHLKKRRLDLGRTQEEVAREIGVREQTYGYWEQGRTEPEIRFYPAIVRFLGYDPTPADPTLSIGERLKATRRARGLSLEKTAELLGVDPTTLWKWEKRGASGRPARRVLRAVEEFLGEE